MSSEILVNLFIRGYRSFHQPLQLLSVCVNENEWRLIYPNLSKLDKFNLTSNNILPGRQEKLRKPILHIWLIINSFLLTRIFIFAHRKQWKWQYFFSSFSKDQTSISQTLHGFFSFFPVIPILEFANDSEYRNAPC